MYFEPKIYYTYSISKQSSTFNMQSNMNKLYHYKE